MLNDSMFFFQFNNSNSNKNFNMTCIQNINNKWQTNQCQSKKNKLSNSYSCVCQNQSPTTLIEQLDDVLLQNQNLNTAFGSQGWFNLTNFKEPYKYIAFWLLAITALLQLILWYFGRKLDQKSLQKEIFSMTPETQLPIIQKQSIDQINLTPSNRFEQKMQKSKNIQRYEKNNDFSQQKQPKSKKISLIQMQKIDNSPLDKQKIEQKETDIKIKSLERESMPFTCKIQSNNENLNKREIIHKMRYFQADLIPSTNQKVGFKEKIEEFQLLDIDQAPTYSSSEKGFVNQQNGTPLKNEDQNKNSNEIEIVNQNPQGKKAYFNNFQQKNFLNYLDH
ncbi:transmembrane protein, putative (macronuclear) [Tetrahymena thermophila SB210]|uniref:Transmembrane protein, putative n=1 Tax=Tetrahymena thermophila (strain SB210) TaxID=312017 RepID=Q23BN4_TETTS|nr:transmembrane protein, putative [Tetrahymena thermophila SB210]EAR94084.2 transmembrane protein, putative [Tetrahymena thermophila SB210]|eukprot:XP_001014329.2 transmembrane protein, putative [Tetrahymena thermophila SB210]